MKPNLGEMLVSANLIDEVQMQIALAEQKRTGKRFGSTLVELKFIDENVLAAFLSKQVDVPCISLLHVDITKKILRKISARTAKDCHAVPIRVVDGRLEVAMADPTDHDLIEIIQAAAGMPIAPLIAPQSSIEKMIEKLYVEETAEETLSSRAAASSGALDPHFLDLIEELENGDYEQRLQRIEENLNNIWTLLEKILRILEDEHGDKKKFVGGRSAIP
jgi:MSHA biogenesis protein MshE